MKRHFLSRFDNADMSDGPPPGMTVEQFRRIESEGFFYV